MEESQHCSLNLMLAFIPRTWAVANTDYSMTSELGTGLVAMVHVPKTAGSSLNAVMQQAFGNGFDHLESANLDDSEVIGRLSKANWISGHLSLDRMRSLIARIQIDPAHLITAVREPVSHVASHYNWLIEIGRRSRQFFNGHPEAIKTMHRVIANSDNSNPDAIIENLSKYSQLFLNCQSRYVLGGRWNAPDLEVNSILKAYEHILTEESIPEFARSVTGKADSVEVFENKSKYHFDKDVFQEPKLVRFLQERNEVDFALYRFVSETR